MLRKASGVLGVLALACLVAAAFAESSNMDALQQTFVQPPDSARPMVRWWWFGPAVTKEGITRELQAIKAGGFGGVEVQPTYPLAVDGGTGGGGENAIHNLKFMSPAFLDMLKFAAATCKEMGLRMDLTLGSGWPYGGPMFSAEEGAGRIETEVVHVKAGEQSVAVPPLREGRTAIAAFAGPTISGLGNERRGGGGGNADLTGLKPIALENHAAQLPPHFAGGDVVFFISGRTGMQVKRPAFGAEGNVIDHLSSSVVSKFIHDIAEPEIQACADNPPYAVFCDSLEVQGENWTDDFLAEFQKRRGYDLTPYLPALIGTIGPNTDAFRYDFGRTVTDLYNEYFNAQFTALAHKYHTRFRVQGYGSPPAGLLSYAFADLPEGELQSNFNTRSFRATRYAASASHLMGIPVTSSETFTWLHTAPFRAIPLDMKGEADIHFLDGINQVICHGWPYTGNGAAYPGWSFYAAAAVDDKNPWYIAMPEVTRYIQRVSALLREGTPANEVALYMPDSDVWAKAGSGFSSLNPAFTGDSSILGQILAAGFNADGFDDGMLAMKGKVDGGTLAFTDTSYTIVVLPTITHMPLETARQLEAFTKGGGTLIALRAPTVVPGLKATEADQQDLAAIMQRIFSGPDAKGLLIDSDAQLSDVLKKSRHPDVEFSPATDSVGFVHRHTQAGELYFIANSSNEPQQVRASFHISGMHAELWNPVTGKIQPASVPEPSPTPLTPAIDLALAPYGSTVVVWSTRTPPAAAIKDSAQSLNLSNDWDVTFQKGPGGEGPPVHMQHLVSWTELPGMRNYSGVATYEKKFTATAEIAGMPSVLNFGTGKPLAGARSGNGFSAQLTPPINGAAIVYLNGQRAGAIWCAPYQVDVSGLVKAGENTLRIEVANTAVNYLAKAGFPNYYLKAIRAQYKTRFDPQGLPLYADPLPSGLLGPVMLQNP